MTQKFLKKRLFLNAFFLSAAIFFMVCLQNRTPHARAAEDNQDIERILLSALPTASNLPTRVQWRNMGHSRIYHSDTEYNASIAWDAHKTIQCDLKKNYYAPVKDWYNIGCHVRYYKNWRPTPQEFQNTRLRLYKSSNTGKPYPDLPGGVLVTSYNPGQQDPRNSVYSIRYMIYFMKEGGYSGYVFARCQIHYYQHKEPCTPSYEARIARAKEVVLSECEHTAQLVWSRLPGGKVEIAAPASGVPQEGPGEQTSLRAQTGTVSPDGAVSPTPGPAGGGVISDTTLPMAAGAAAGVAAVGALAILLAQGIPIREGLGELMNLLRGNLAAVYPEPSGSIGPGTLEPTVPEIPKSEEAGTSPPQQEQDKDGRAYEEAWDRFKEERSQYEYTSRDHSGDQMEKVREEMAKEAAGTLSDLDRSNLNTWIDIYAPSDQAAEDMRQLVQRMVTKTGDGTTLGDYEEIRRALGQELQRTNQPDLRYMEKYALRDEIMENAPVLSSAREYYSDYASVLGDSVDEATAMVSDYVKYVEGYKASYENHPYLAHGKAAVQMGVKYVAGKNPAMALADTPLKYLTKFTMGRDASPSKFLEFQVNTLFDAATGELGDKPIAALDFDNPEVAGKIYNSQIKGIEAQMENPNLSSGEKKDLSGMLAELKDKMSRLREE